MLGKDIPFHPGELAAQEHAGAGDIAVPAAPFIRDFMPDQHRAFYEAQPFIVASASDAEGRIWATIVVGADGFIRSPDARTLDVHTQIHESDPLANALLSGTDIGLIGIELATRRRNRLSGQTRRTDTGLRIDIRQSFGNCPQYINERNWWRVARAKTVAAHRSASLSETQIARIQAADTLFIGSGQRRREDVASNGFDASHRGGASGFVHIQSPTRLRIPDYAGNNFFNTIVNLLENPRIGLLFVDFATGGLLHLSGRARIDWAPNAETGALRVIEVDVEAVVDRPAAFALRRAKDPQTMRKLVVTGKVKDSEDITSFYLAPTDGEPLLPFQAGQHLPIAIKSPGQETPTLRSYSLSGSQNKETYRITVKRAPKGQASRYLHDVVNKGDEFEAGPPAGDFVLPEGNEPIVLVSAGVGITPVLYMLHQLSQDGRDRPVWFIHGTRNGRLHAMRDEVTRLIASSPNLQHRWFYSAPDDTDQRGRDFDVHGGITATDLLALEPGPHAHFRLCGPSGFVADIQSGLEANGVPSDQTHFETFG